MAGERRRRPSYRTAVPGPALGAPGPGVGARLVLVVYVLALMLIPANLTISALGAVGTPALLIGLLALLLWLGAQMNRSHATLSPPQPIRRAMLLFLIAVMISYVAATMRPIEALELNGADRGLLMVASWLGIVLLASDGLPDTTAVEAPLRALVAAGGIVAALGIAQFVTGLSLIDGIQIPGLEPNSTVNVTDRDGFTRAAGTATHPIEFGVALTMILPVALHFAFADTDRSRLRRWWTIPLIGAAIPITVSRSALVGLIVGLAFLIPTWPRRRRRISYAVLALSAVAVYVAIPGMLGTLSKLFTGIGNDGSVASRTDSYDLAFDFIARAPVFGRGLSTFLPQYRILDNQYLGLLIELGVFGTLAMIVLFVVSIRAALQARIDAPPRTRSLATSLAAMLTAAALSFATFDAFGFAQVACLTMLGIGLVGALNNNRRREELRELLERPRADETARPR